MPARLTGLLRQRTGGRGPFRARPGETLHRTRWEAAEAVLAEARRVRNLRRRRVLTVIGGVAGLGLVACALWWWGGAIQSRFVRTPDVRAQAPASPPAVPDPGAAAGTAAAPRVPADPAVTAAFERDVLRAQAPAVRTPLQDFEGARRAVRDVDGISSAAWLDRRHLFALVVDNAQRSVATAASVCTRIAAFGDVSGVTVQLQSMAAGSGSELDVLGHRCGAGGTAAAGPFAVEPVPRPDDEALRALRLQQAAERDAIEARGDRSAEQAAAMKLLEENTPEF